MFLEVSKVVIFVLSAAFASHIAYEFYYKKKKQIKSQEIHEVIMFSQGTTQLKKSKHSRCMITISMDRVLYYLNSPRYSLDICMYVITNIDITYSILKLYSKGVKIRVIIDADMAYSTGATVRRLDKHGIPIRWIKSTYLMHHKFCLIDACDENVIFPPLVMMGSLNWTNQALSGNWEHVVVTSQNEIVTEFRAEFERLWIQFKPIVE